ncbi:Protein CBG14005 [Caenorhabditis briggsae]|nr:Protein CBG14005 [Caenorhabditis briggsae]CAP32693.1 Protein CBG14005 [Caenorhabditis briggsae]
MIRLIFLLSLSAAPSFGISCYGYNDYQEVVETLHHRKFCIAVYEVSDGTGAFGGGERHPSRIPNIVNMTKGNDCVMQHVQSNLGIPSSDMWLCYCYTEMCNYPFTWKEFVSRGYTLKPTYAAGFEKK